MLARKYTLNTKECNYIQYKHDNIHVDDFVIFAINQYPNRRYDQHSIQLSTKFAKSSVHRHIVKRQFYAIFQELSQDIYMISNNNQNIKHKKCLRIPKKETIAKLETVRKSKDKIYIKNFVKEFLQKNISKYLQKNKQ